MAILAEHFGEVGQLHLSRYSQPGLTHDIYRIGGEIRRCEIGVSGNGFQRHYRQVDRIGKPFQPVEVEFLQGFLDPQIIQFFEPAADGDRLLDGVLLDRIVHQHQVVPD